MDDVFGVLEDAARREGAKRGRDEARLDVAPPPAAPQQEINWDDVFRTRASAVPETSWRPPSTSCWTKRNGDGSSKRRRVARGAACGRRAGRAAPSLREGAHARNSTRRADDARPLSPAGAQPRRSRRGR